MDKFILLIGVLGLLSSTGLLIVAFIRFENKAAALISICLSVVLLFVGTQWPESEASGTADDALLEQRIAALEAQQQTATETTPAGGASSTPSPTAEVSSVPTAPSPEPSPTAAEEIDYGDVIPASGSTELVSAAIAGTNVTWALDSGLLTVSGTGDILSGGFASPWENWKASIGEAIIGEGITSIGTWAFAGCNSLRSVSLPSTLTTIGESAFDCCFWLESIEIPDSVTTIRMSAFRTSGLESITIPASVTTIEHYALGYGINEATGSCDPVEGFTISGYRGTAAETYANQNGFAFVPLD